MRLFRNSLSTAFMAILLAPASSALAGPPCPGGGAPGTITVTEKKLDRAVASVAKELKAAQQCSLKKGEEDAGWKLNVVAHLNKQAGADQVNLVLYDQSKPAKAGNEVQAYQINTTKTAKISATGCTTRATSCFAATVATSRWAA